MEQGKYGCDGGCIVVKIGKRNFIHYNNDIGDGVYDAFKFESNQEFRDYLNKHHILEPYYKGCAVFYNAEVLSYDLSYDLSYSNANTLFKLKGRYDIYVNNTLRCGDFYFVKS